MGSHIGKPTPIEVGVVRVVLLGLRVDMVVKIRLDSGILVPGTGEVIRETTRRGIPGRFGDDIGSSADRSDVGASGREDGIKLGSDQVASLAGRADTCTWLG